jgi:thermitase
MSNVTWGNRTAANATVKRMADTAANRAELLKQGEKDGVPSVVVDLGNDVALISSRELQTVSKIARTMEPGIKPGDDLKVDGVGGKVLFTDDGFSEVKADDVVVAVVDTGIDTKHPAFEGRLVKPFNAIDGSTNVEDHQGHGTHCAGIIAGARNDQQDQSGVAPQVKIMPIKASDDGTFSSAAMAKGIRYAVDNGAKVISMSVGGPMFQPSVHHALEYAKKQGVLVVVAAGNDGSTTKNYPAAYDNSLSVGASNQQDGRAYFSTYGSTVDIAAPGVSILSTTKDGQYGTEDGTSMASPHVAAAAALVFSQHPTWTPAQVREVLCSTGDPVSGFTGSTSLKRLNVAKAVGATSAPAPTTTPAPSSGDTTAPTISNVGGSIGTTYAYVTWSTNEAADTQAEIGTTTNPTSRTAYQSALVTSHKVTFSNLLRGHTYYFRARSRDKAGNLRVSGVYRFTTH